MSDELIEGHTLRGRRPGRDRQEAHEHQPDSGDAQTTDLSDELPFIVLEPPPEAGDVIRQQMGMPTRPALRPIEDEGFTPGAPPAASPDREGRPAEAPSLAGRPEPPARPVMKLPAIRLDEEEEGEEHAAPGAEPQTAPPSERPTGNGEVVDAEWVIEVGERLVRLQQEEKAPSGGRRRWLALAAVIVLIGLVFFVPLIAGKQGAEGNPPVEGTAQADGENLAASGVEPTAAPPVAPSPTPTPLPPYRQGHIVFASARDGNFEIYRLDMVAQQVARLTDDPASDRWPTRSPDGERIVFVSDRAGDDDLYLMDTGDGSVVQLTRDPGMDRWPAWSPDGGRIVFARETVDGSALLMLDTACFSAPETCEEHIVPLTTERYDLYPAWSPDGRQIAFAASDFPGLPWSIALLDLEDGSFRLLPGTGSSDRSPAWSPDGERIAFVSLASGNPDLWVMSPAGEEACQLTFDEANDVELAWSPDGSYLVFASDRGDEEDFELYLIRADCEAPPGSPEESLIQLTSNEADDLNPAWSP